MWRSREQWQGPALVATVCAFTLWLAATGQLELYVAPKHAGFATIMSFIGLIAAGLSAGRLKPHMSSKGQPPVARVASAVALSLALGVASTMLLLPPATLSASAAAQREINSSVSPSSPSDEEVNFSGEFDLTVPDWAALLRSTSDPAVFAGRQVLLTGFITPDEDDPDNVFYVTRFAISHCAIDAQSYGVPIYSPNWQQEFARDQWIDATGEFTANPSAKSSQPVALVPQDLTRIETPDDPYLFQSQT